MPPALDTVITPLVDGAPDPPGTRLRVGTPPAALPPEWAEWAEEPGHSVSLREAGETLGSLHVVMVGRDEAWLEGLWVRPSARGRGIGRKLVGEADAVAIGYGATIVRTAVPARDYAALAVAEGMGFLRRSEATVAVAEITAGPINVPYDAQVAPARAVDVPALIGLIGASDHLAGWHGLVPLGWRFRAVRPELMRGLVNDGRVLRSGEAVEGVVAFAVRGQAVVIAFLDGPRAHRQALYGAVAERARVEGARRIVLFAPDAEGWTGIRAAHTAHPWCPDGLVIVERRTGR